MTTTNQDEKVQTRVYTFQVTVTMDDYGSEEGTTLPNKEEVMEAVSDAVEMHVPSNASGLGYRIGKCFIVVE